MSHRCIYSYRLAKHQGINIITGSMTLGTGWEEWLCKYHTPKHIAQSKCREDLTSSKTYRHSSGRGTVAPEWF